MQTAEPRLVYEIEEWGKIRQVPLAPFYVRDVKAFFDFCQDNGQDTLRFERDPDGRVRLMPPSGSKTGFVNAFIVSNLNTWNEAQENPGYLFDSSAGFQLPNGAIRAPDASWVTKGRYEALTREQQEGFPPLCPDFVVEVMSPSDRLTTLKRKMEEYKANGARLGWLIDRKRQVVHIYRPGQVAQEIRNPTEVSGDPELPGFILPMARIFD
jgi:Uma2 family endonuclease